MVMILRILNWMRKFPIRLLVEKKGERQMSMAIFKNSVTLLNDLHELREMISRIEETMHEILRLKAVEVSSSVSPVVKVDEPEEEVIVFDRYITVNEAFKLYGTTPHTMRRRMQEVPTVYWKSDPFAVPYALFDAIMRERYGFVGERFIVKSSHRGIHDGYKTASELGCLYNMDYGSIASIIRRLPSAFWDENPLQCHEEVFNVYMGRKDAVR